MTVAVSHKPAVSQWAGRRKRAQVLAERFPFAAEMLNFYQKLAEVQERIWELAQEEQPDPVEVPDWATELELLPMICAVAESDGPSILARSAAAFARVEPEKHVGLLRAYLADVPMPELQDSDVELGYFLARATVGPILEALDLESRITSALSGDERRCPWCWGRPQCQVLGETPEGAATCELVCGRCSRSWKFTRRVCSSCGEASVEQLAVFEASEDFPHLRTDACQTCKSYIVTIDRRRDGQAVPLVDEMCALPLELWTREQGFEKVHPNLMGV